MEKQGLFQRLLNFMKKTGGSASQFSLNPSFSNQQVGSSMQTIQNMGFPTPIVPSPVSSTAIGSMVRNEKIQEAAKKADKDYGGVFNQPRKKDPKVTPETPETPKEEDDKFNFERFMKDQRDFDQKVLNQAYVAGGLDAAGKSIMEGSKVAGESVIPNMIAGTTGLLASLAKGNQALATAFGVPISPVKRMGYYG